MQKTAPLREFDVVVIGAGIAGASAAAEISAHAKVALLDMENLPGYHTTGRSAAVFAPSYGPAPIRALTRASEAFFRAPPAGFATDYLFYPRKIMMIARSDQIGALDTLIETVGTDTDTLRVSGADLLAHQPLLRPGYAAAAMIDLAGQDIDVNALHQGYLRVFKKAGGVFLANAGVTGLARDAGAWRIDTPQGVLRAPLVVNAAGAWAQDVATLAGAEDIGLVPKRRTAMIVAAPQGINVTDLPITIDVQEQMYLKPDAGKLLISPADETPTPPCDAQPEEIDVALCVDRILTAFDIAIPRIDNKWAGLRSFVGDKAPVVGFSDRAEGFFWLAGQGGYGIQSSPALARLAAAGVLGRKLPQDIMDQGLDPDSISPARLRVMA